MCDDVFAIFSLAALHATQISFYFPKWTHPTRTHLNASRKERGLSHYIRQFLHLCGQRFARDDFHAKIQVTNKHTQRAIVHDDANLILPIEKKNKRARQFNPYSRLYLAFLI